MSDAKLYVRVAGGLSIRVGEHPFSDEGGPLQDTAGHLRSGGASADKWR